MSSLYHSDRKFLEDLKQGSNEAWTKAVNLWSPGLYSYLRKKGATHEVAEEILAETMAAAVTAIQNFDGQNAKVSTLIYRIATFKLVSYWRSSKHETGAEIPRNAIAAQMDQDILMEMEEAISRLNADERETLQLHYNNGFTIAEIAGIMHRTSSAIESTMTRARGKLRKFLSS